MKKIDLSTAVKKAEQMAPFLKSANSPVWDGVMTTFKRLYDECGAGDLFEDDWISSGSDPFFIYNSVRGEEFYDFLTQSKKAGVVGLDLQAGLRQVIVFPDYGFSITVDLEVSCPLPEEDIELFEDMGKIEHDRGSYDERSVFCSL